jgi:23S rRNA (guanosine2251-2'-O)-methyltransferase
MYNDLMPNTSYEIRICESCGLRFPLVEGHPFGARCPACVGNTRVLLSKELITEPDSNLHPKAKKATSLLKETEKKEEGHRNLVVLLDNIRSAWNVGSILRSADGFGFTHAYLCGITPTADNEAVTKTSLGAEDSVPWSYHKDAVKLVRGLKKEGWTVYALEDDKRAISLESDSLPSKVREQAPALQMLIVGNEVTGVDPELLDLCDAIFYIPMRGEKKSFNVAIAFGIAAYALTIVQLEN